MEGEADSGSPTNFYGTVFGWPSNRKVAGGAISLGSNCDGDDGVHFSVFPAASVLT